MNRLVAGAALLCALTPLAFAQATNVTTPPPKAQIKPVAPRTTPAHWEPRQLDGAFLEPPEFAQPIPIIPPEQRPGYVSVNHTCQEHVCEVLSVPGVTPIPPSSIKGGPATLDQSLGTMKGSRSQPLMQDWESIGPNGLTPPDPDCAVGYDYVVTVTNDDFATYDKAGNELYYADIHDYLGYDTSYLLYDPKVIFDPWNARWVMMYHKKKSSTEESSLILIISNDADPFGVGGAYYYDFNALQGGGTADASFADYFDLGYSSTAVTVGGNMFRFSGGFRWARIWVFDKAEIYNALAAGSLRFSNLTNADGSTTDTPRACSMQTSWSEGGVGIAGTWVNSRWGGGDKLTLWKIKDPFGTYSLTKADISVSAYSNPPDAVQPSGATLDIRDPRLMTAVITNDDLGSNGVELFTGLATAYSTVAGARLFKVDPTINTLEWETTFWGNTSYYYWFPCVAADYSGSAYWCFARTGPGSTAYPELRYVDFNQGTFSGSSSSLRLGSDSYSGWRWGDYFGGQMDWGDYNANYWTAGKPAKVWLYGEFGKATNSWGTQVGATSVWNQGNLSSVSPSSTYVTTGLAGGPFSPAYRDYTLTNSGEVGLTFEVTSLPTWLDASPDLDQAYPGSTTVRLQVNSNANSLSPGCYTDTVIFRDTYNGGNTFYRSVQLVVQTNATATFRNDAGGTNPAGYSSSAPIMGGTWNGTVNNGLTGNTWAHIAGYASPLSVYIASVGDYLLMNITDSAGELMALPAKAGSGMVSFSSPVPTQCVFIGLRVYTQAYGFGGTGIRLQNAYDLKLGL